MAADGRTKLYGQIQFPSNFDPSKTYPTLIAVYGGPESVALMGLFRNLGALVTNVLSVGFDVLVMQKLSTAASRESIVCSGVLPMCDRRFWAIACWVISRKGSG